MKKLIRSKSDTKLILEYKVVSEALNTNLAKLKTDYLKKGHLLPRSSIFKKKKSCSKKSTKKKHEISNLIKNLKVKDNRSILVENFKNNIIKILRLKNSFNEKMFSKLSYDYKENSNYIFEALLTKIEVFKMEKSKERIESFSDVNEKNTDNEDDSFNTNVEKIIHIIKVFMSIDTSVLFEAKSLIFKEFEDLISELQETIDTDISTKKDNM